MSRARPASADPVIALIGLFALIFLGLGCTPESSSDGGSDDAAGQMGTGGEMTNTGGTPSSMGGEPNAMGGAPSGMGGEPNAMGGAPSGMGGEPNAMGGEPNAMGGAPSGMGGAPSGTGGAPGGMDGAELPGANPELERRLLQDFNTVYRIGPFYIASTDEIPRETGGTRVDYVDAVVEMAVQLFSSFLDQDEDGAVDHPPLLDALGEGFLFAIGYDRTLRPLEERYERDFGLYVMSMKTDIWPFIPGYDGTYHHVTNRTPFRVGIERLTTSLWRPTPFNALWEEVFHTITEAYRSPGGAAARGNSDWSFDRRRSVLGQNLAEAISRGSMAYDISEQNELEGGNYDFETAVNEYVHQIWLLNNGGRQDILSRHQIDVFRHMETTPGFPMTVNKRYPLDGLGVEVESP